MRKFLQWMGLLTAPGRRAWGFLALLGSSGIMTAFAAWAMYLVRADTGLVFWFGVLAHIQLLVCVTGFMALFIRRNYDIDTAIAKLKITDSVTAVTREREISNDRASPDEQASESGAGDPSYYPSSDDRFKERLDIQYGETSFQPTQPDHFSGGDGGDSALQRKDPEERP